MVKYGYTEKSLFEDYSNSESNIEDSIDWEKSSSTNIFKQKQIRIFVSGTLIALHLIVFLLPKYNVDIYYIPVSLGMITIIIYITHDIFVSINIHKSLIDDEDYSPYNEKVFIPFVFLLMVTTICGFIILPLSVYSTIHDLKRSCNSTYTYNDTYISSFYIAEKANCTINIDNIFTTLYNKYCSKFVYVVITTSIGLFSLLVAIITGFIYLLLNRYNNIDQLDYESIDCGAGSNSKPHFDYHHDPYDFDSEYERIQTKSIYRENIETRKKYCLTDT